MKPLCIILTFMPLPVFAGTPEFLKQYDTWGSFNLVCSTFERIALMMSDTRYFVMIFCIAVLGLVFGQFHAYLKMFKRGAGQMTLMYGAALFFTGIVIYTATIVPKTTMHIYDRSYNQYKPVGNLPVLLVWTAGFANYLERTFIDIIETSSDPLSYADSAGGNVLSLVRNFFDSNTDLSSSDSPSSGPDRLFQLSLRKYLSDCVTFEMGKQGSQINVNDFFSTSDFKKILAKANSMAVNTRYYDQDSLSGRQCSCYTSWTKLDAGFNALSVSAVNDHTGKVLYKSGIAAEKDSANLNLIRAADKKITDFFNATIMKNREPTQTGQIFTQWLIAAELFNAMQEGDVKRISSKKTGTALTGAGIMASEWMPVMRSVMFAVYMCLFPFLTLLVVTPLAGRALKFMLGTLVFFSAWSVCDVLTHSFAMQQAGYLFEGLKNQQLGLNNLLMFSDQASKGLAVLGAFKFSSMAIAGMLTTVLVKSGSSTAGTMGSQTAAAEQQGAAGMGMMHSPEQRAAAYRGLTGAQGTDRLANTGGQYGMEQASAFGQTSDYTSNLMTKAALENNDDRGWNRSWLDNTGLSSSFRDMSGAQKNAYGSAASSVKNLAAGKALSGKKDDPYKGLKKIYDAGSVQGEKQRAETAGYEKYTEQMTPEQREQVNYVKHLREDSPGVVQNAANEFLENGELSYFTKNQMKNLTETQEGRAVVQNVSRGVSLSNVSAKQADTINQTAVKSGLVSKGQEFIEAGHSVTMDVGYDRETGELSCSNLSAQKMMNVGEGTRIDRNTGISEKEVTKEGVTHRQKTLDNRDVYERTVKGSDKHYYNDNITEHSGFHSDRDGFADKTMAGTMAVNPNSSEKELFEKASGAVAEGRFIREVASIPGLLQSGITAVKSVVSRKPEAREFMDIQSEVADKKLGRITGKMNDQDPI